MSVTVTLTPALIAAVVYVVVAVMMGFAGFIYEMDFVNPSYGFVVIIAILWPLIAVNLVTGYFFDIYLMDVWNYLKR